MKFLPALILSCVCLGGCKVIHVAEAVQGSGKATTESRRVANFRKIVVEGAAEVQARIGKAEPVRLTWDENLLKQVELEVKGDTLRIRQTGNTQSRQALKVSIVQPRLDGVTLQGAGTVRVAGLRDSLFTAVILGSGEIEATGTASQVEARIEGSGNIRLRNLKAPAVTAEITGSGNIEAYANVRSRGLVTGTGTITVYGGPKIQETKVTGSGSIRHP